MKPIVEKVLKSGLVERHMAEVLEKWGNLPPGASDVVKDDALKGATLDQLHKLATEMGDLVDRERTLKETQLDIEKIRWPTEISIIEPKTGIVVAKSIPAVIDRMGRLYFRKEDIDEKWEEWFVLGYCIRRLIPSKKIAVEEIILDSTPLFVGDQFVCLQVCTSEKQRYAILEE